MPFAFYPLMIILPIVMMTTRLCQAGFGAVEVLQVQPQRHLRWSWGRRIPIGPSAAPRQKHQWRQTSLGEVGFRMVQPRCHL